MDVLRVMDNLLRRESGAEELLNLLKDPYASQVRFYQCAWGVSDSSIAVGNIRIRQFGHLHWLYTPPCH
jgi:hypothetical protein